MNIEAKVVNKYTFSLDGELFYYSQYYVRPYYYFKMFKILFDFPWYTGNGDMIRWAKELDTLFISLRGVTNTTNSRIDFWSGSNSVFLLKDDKTFIDKLSNKYCGLSHRGPENTPSARGMVPSNKIPKVFELDSIFYYFDKELYDRYK